MNTGLQKKVNSAIKLLRSIPMEGGPVEIAYSGGKDSDVILELAKMAGISYRAIYKNTTIDPPGTIKHCKEKGVEVFAPAINFFDLVKKKGAPTRYVRHCCDFLKEYKVLDFAVHGIRRCESTARAKRYKEPTVCRFYGSKKKHVEVFLPILEWTNEDVAQFIAEHGIKCHPLYYDERGVFHVERRLGCIGCPLQSNRGVLDFQKYPKLFKRLVRAEQYFIDTHPSSEAKLKFGTAYNVLFNNLFFDSYEGYNNAVTGGLFPEVAIDAKSFLEDYFKIDLTI